MLVSVRSRLRPSLAAALLALGIAMTAGLLIVSHPGWSVREMVVVEAVHGFGNTVFDQVALAIDVGFGPSGATLLAVIVLAGASLLRRSWWTTLRIFVLFAVPWACAEALKLAVQRPRPNAALLESMLIPTSTTYSYPSGHTAFAATLCCAIVLMLPRGRLRRVAVIFSVVIVVVTAWSRVYLGAHYPTDVLASMFVVPFVSLAVAQLLASFRIVQVPPTPPTRAATATVSEQQSER